MTVNHNDETAQNQYGKLCWRVDANGRVIVAFVNSTTIRLLGFDRVQATWNLYNELLGAKFTLQRDTTNDKVTIISETRLDIYSTGS